MANKLTPTDSELLLLEALWNQPNISVQEVHEEVSKDRDLAYTTVLTQLQRMHKKGMLTRTKVGKQHLYKAVIERESVEDNLLSQLSKRVFGGSKVRLALSALGKDTPTESELAELQQWLDEQKAK